MLSPAITRISWFVATGAGIGRVPFAPGTVASIAAAGVWYYFYPSQEFQWMIGGVVIAVGIWGAGRLARRLEEKDPSCVVIDECAGMWLALAGLPRHVPTVCLAFFLFRLLDIVKWFPIRRLERLPGGVGIMMDDIAAGLITRVVLGIGLRLASG